MIGFSRFEFLGWVVIEIFLGVIWLEVLGFLKIFLNIFRFFGSLR